MHFLLELCELCPEIHLQLSTVGAWKGRNSCEKRALLLTRPSKAKDGLVTCDISYARASQTHAHTHHDHYKYFIEHRIAMKLVLGISGELRAWCSSVFWPIFDEMPMVSW